jgi:imidazolonepropionase-like amidohydrolase
VAAPYVLYGTVVTMDAARRIISDGAVFIDATGKIAAVQPRLAEMPAGFDAHTLAVETKATIYPSLIDVHNHPPYNIMPIWHVDKKYADREAWRGSALYAAVLKAPMKKLQTQSALVPAIVRFVEAKAVIGGVTTTQGTALTTDRMYQGLIRVVESTGDAALPNSTPHLENVDSGQAAEFYKKLQTATSCLLHLSEGVSASARGFFEDLQLPDGTWALAANLAGIHCVALQAGDFDLLKKNASSVIWSPLSNLLLYGQTTDIATVLKDDILLAMGPDWSFSGSKNAFGELKAIRSISDILNIPLSDVNLLEMATINAARILKWDKATGSIEPGKYADLLVVDAPAGDPYHGFISSKEERIQLVILAGAPLFGDTTLMSTLGARGELVHIGSEHRTLAMPEENADPDVKAITLASATAQLESAFLALNQPGGGANPDSASKTQVRLRLPELDEGPMFRGPSPDAVAKIVPPTFSLDQLAVANDPNYFAALRAQVNLSPYEPKFVDGIAALYA